MHRNWSTESRNGYTAVDEYVNNEIHKGPVFMGPKRQAIAIAVLLNAAYMHGRRDAITSLGETVNTSPK